MASVSRGSGYLRQRLVRRKRTPLTQPKIRLRRGQAQWRYVTLHRLPVPLIGRPAGLGRFSDPDPGEWYAERLCVHAAERPRIILLLLAHIHPRMMSFKGDACATVRSGL
jgi:hypothetical protein